jgi:hypothetical protein
VGLSLQKEPSRPGRRRWKWIRRAFWTLLTLSLLGLLGLRLLTREVFLRGPVLRSILGPEYAGQLELGEIRVGLFPPTLRAYDMRLLDSRPGPGEPQEVGRLGKLVMHLRWIPWRRLHVDHFEARGLVLHLARNQRGEINVLRAWGDMQSGKIPPPIRLEWREPETIPEWKVFIGDWDVGDFRITWTDRLRAGPPRRAAIDIAQAVLLRANALEPLDINNGLPLSIEGYLAIPGTDGSLLRRPLHAKLTLTHPQEPSRLGVDLRCLVKPLLEELGETTPAHREAFPRDRPIPPWSDLVRSAPPILDVGGSWARKTRASSEISNILLTLSDPSFSAATLNVTEGRYDMRSGVADGAFQMQGTPRELVRRVQTLHLPLQQSVLHRLTSAILDRVSQRDGSTSPPLVLVNVKWKYHPERSLPPGSFQDGAGDNASMPRGELSLDFLVQLQPPGYAAGELDSSATLEKVHRMELSGTARAWLPDEKVSLHQLQCNIFRRVRRPAERQEGAGEGTGEGMSDLLIFRGRLAAPGLDVPLASLAQSLTHFCVHSTSAALAPDLAMTYSLFPASEPHMDRWGKTLRCVEECLRMLGYPAATLDFEFPPCAPSNYPGLSELLGADTAAGAIGNWKLRVLLPGGSPRAQIAIEGDLSQLQPMKNGPVFGMAMKSALRWETGRITIEDFTARVAESHEHFYDFRIQNSWVEPAAGRGEWSLDAGYLDSRWIELIAPWGGDQLDAWIAPYRHLLGDRPPPEASPFAGPKTSVKFQGEWGPVVRWKSGMQIEGIPVRRFTESGPRQWTSQLMEISHSGSLDRRSAEAALEDFSLRLRDSPGIPARFEVHLTEQRALRFPWKNRHILSLALGFLVDETATAYETAMPEEIRLTSMALAHLSRINACLGAPGPSFALRIRDFSLAQLPRLLRLPGVVFEKGTATLECLARFSGKELPDGRVSAWPEEPRIMDWVATATLQQVQLKEFPEPFVFTAEARGWLTPHVVGIEDFDGETPRSSLTAVGHYHLGHQQGRMEFSFAGLHVAGIRYLKNLGTIALGDALRIDEYLPGGFLAHSCAGNSTVYHYAGKAELDSRDERLRLSTSLKAAGIEFLPRQLGPLALTTRQELFFHGRDRVELRHIESVVSGEKVSTPLLTLRLPAPVELRRHPANAAAWLRDDMEGTPTLELEIAGDAALLAGQSGHSPLPWSGRRFLGGSFKARSSSVLAPTSPLLSDTTLQGGFEGLKWEGVDDSFQLPFTGRFSASSERVELDRLELEWTRGGRPVGRMLVEAAQEFATSDWQIATTLLDASPGLLELMPPALWQWLRSPAAQISGHRKITSRAQNRYRDLVETLQARNVALHSDATPSSSPDALHPPLLLELDRMETLDRATTSTTLERLRLSARLELLPAAPPILQVDLYSPMTVNPASYSFIQLADRAPTSPSLLLRLDGFELEPFARAISHLAGLPPLRGRVHGSAELLAMRSGTDFSQTGSLLNGTLRLEDLRVIEPVAPPTTSRRTTETLLLRLAHVWRSPPRDEEQPDYPLNVHADFVLRTRGRSLVLDRFALTSPNNADFPNDQLSITGTIYGLRRGFSPDCQVRGRFLELTKYSEFFAAWIRTQAAAERLRQATLFTSLSMSSSATDPLRAPGDEFLQRARVRVDLDRVHFRGSMLSHLGGVVRYDSRRITIADFEAALGEGRLNLDAVLDLTQRPAIAYQAFWEVDEVDLRALLNWVAPEAGQRLRALVSGNGEISGYGLTPARLTRTLRSESRLTFEDGYVEGLPSGWLFGHPEEFSGTLEARVAHGTADFTLRTHPDDPRKEVRFQGAIRDFFGEPHLEALLRTRLRTQVGPRPPRETGLILPPPQTVIGTAWRIAGPLDDPDARRVRLETYEY